MAANFIRSRSTRYCTVTLANRLAHLSKPAQRAFAIFGMLLCAAAGWMLIAYPVSAFLTSQDAWRIQSSALLAKAHGPIAAEGRIRDRLETLDQLAIWGLLYPPTDSAVSEVRQDLSSICAAAGVQIESLADLPASHEPGFVRLSQRVSIIATAESFGALLAGVRQHPKYLRIERLSVTSPQFQPHGAQPELSAIVEIAGFSKAWTDDLVPSSVAVAESPRFAMLAP